ncbi:unnamed protein product [Protopolystoma xenopodis]|uniref:Uncharacterized protein n=1 Tax=Protopolystoma xenopodis TaxID=117903 RepID=A0A3S5FCE8_9PLAT|nr:unnamed protein product [Protopolystoma xenopodis]
MLTSPLSDAISVYSERLEQLRLAALVECERLGFPKIESGKEMAQNLLPDQVYASRMRSVSITCSPSFTQRQKPHPDDANEALLCIQPCKKSRLVTTTATIIAEIDHKDPFQVDFGPEVGPSARSASEFGGIEDRLSATSSLSTVALEHRGAAEFLSRSGFGCSFYSQAEADAHWDAQASGMVSEDDTDEAQENQSMMDWDRVGRRELGELMRSRENGRIMASSLTPASFSSFRDQETLRPIGVVFVGLSSPEEAIRYAKNIKI